MASETTGGGNAGLAFIVGGLLVVVAAVVLYMVFMGPHASKKTIDVNINTPNISAPAAPAPAKSN